MPVHPHIHVDKGYTAIGGAIHTGLMIGAGSILTE